MQNNKILVFIEKYFFTVNKSLFISYLNFSIHILNCIDTYYQSLYYYVFITMIFKFNCFHLLK